MIRNDLENIENQILSPYAQKSAQTRGRVRPIEQCELRTEYQRDRDRILHCKSFRRLKHKTQVFLSPEGDHYRTRLTHTLEVSQIARTISRALRLNEDLTEAIALGHDLGHTPFGHAGERALRECTGAFEHNAQSLRVVDVLENGVGLNLTWEVMDGILNHKKGMIPATLEGRVVNLSDRIAYMNHDIDDAMRAGLMKLSDIPKKLVQALGETHGQRLNTMVLDVVQTSLNRELIGMSTSMEQTANELREFLFSFLYQSEKAKRDEEKILHVILMLWGHYMEKPEHMPEEYGELTRRWGEKKAVIDYIAGMSDGYALRKFGELFVPKSWQ
ncbi:MAG: deoxyguanosinetriphosphate triphosphohydrolase [Eubacteriales bacterium]